MRVRIEYCMAPMNHMGSYEDVIEMSPAMAFRMWRSSFSPLSWSSSEDYHGCKQLEQLLQKLDPQHRYPVSAVVQVRLASRHEPLTLPKQEESANAPA